MAGDAFSSKERAFVDQADEFLAAALNSVGVSRLDDVPPLSRVPARAAEPFVVRTSDLSSTDLMRWQEQYRSEGLIYFVIESPVPRAVGERHPLFNLVDRLARVLPLDYPLEHPLELHPEVNAIFGADGTVKVFDLQRTRLGYREQGETAEMFDMHHDGLGSGGTVDTVILYMDSAPLAGGYTYFQNILRVALELARDDSEAFRSLFLPDALTITRPRGKGALRVVCPVVFLNERREPQSTLRLASGEYSIGWKDVPGLTRARTLLEFYGQPFAPGSVFLLMSRPGHGCISANRFMAHGRTGFVNGEAAETRRVLSRKWFMRSSRDATYKHVPGMFIASPYAELFPEYFGADRLEGEWLLDSATDNVFRVR